MEKVPGKLRAILIVFAILLPGSVQALLIQNIHGKYEIEKKHSSRFLRTKALEDSFANAVTQFVIKILNPELLQQKKNFINSFFRTRAQRYVDTFTIQKEWKEGNTYNVLVNLELNESLIIKDLAKVGLLKTLDYIPSYSIDLKCDAPEKICMDFLTAITAGVKKDVARYTRSITEADFSVTLTLKIYQFNATQPVFYHYLKAVLEAATSAQSQNMGNFQQEFFATGETFSGAMRKLLEKLREFFAFSVINYAVNEWKKNYFQLTEYTLLLEKTFNVDKAMDFIYELKKYPGYLKNPHISYISPSGIAISFTGGTLTEAVIEKLKRGSFGPFKVELISRKGANLHIAIY